MSSFTHPFKLAVAVLAVGSLYSCSGPAEKAGPVAVVGENGDTAAKPKADPPKPEVPTIAFPRPKTVKGIYVTAWTAGGTKKMEKLLKLLDDTELNAMVIDIRDSGEMYFDTGIPLAKAVKSEQHAVAKPKELMEKLQKRGVYPIARIACFRDVFVPKAMPERAVQLSNGKPWKDRSGHMWLDPYNKKNWEYLAETVEYALDLGFPEVQLDYVRFPSEGKSSTQVFPGKKDYEDKDALPADVIAEFAKYIGEKVKAKKGTYSADIFGIISSGKSDQGIGQTLEKIAEPFDLVCPMVYPSHFAKGEYGIANPNASPYAIVKKSLQDYKERIPDKLVRPWLQDFSLGVKYGPEQVKAQIKAAKELGYDEFLLWNAGNTYTQGGLKKASDEEKKPAEAGGKSKVETQETGPSASHN